eukprot:6376266-Alexandrium_andersonii.AAC.1
MRVDLQDTHGFETMQFCKGVMRQASTTLSMRLSTPSSPHAARRDLPQHCGSARARGQVLPCSPGEASGAGQRGRGLDGRVARGRLGAAELRQGGRAEAEPRGGRADGRCRDQGH